MTLDPFDRPAWTGTEVAPGVTDMERRWPHVTFRRDNPAVHYHYWQDDADTDRRGYGVTDMVCHACNEGIRYFWPASFIAPGAGPRMEAYADAFAAKHHGHLNVGGEFLCPLYNLTDAVDLRVAALESEEPR
jgi:hypothetical protein